MGEIRILLLEDTPSDAELVERSLRRGGLDFTALRVDTEPAFKQALSDFQPDAVLADYSLPSYNGRAALEYVRRAHPDIPVLMVTGAIGEEAAVDLLTAGARDYILKDRMTRLPTAVQRVLQERHEEQLRREAEEKFRKIGESAQDAIIMIDADRRISFWNTAAERVFGYSAAEAMGQELHPLITPPEAQAAFAQGFGHFRESGEGPIVGRVIEVTALRKGGEEFPVELSVAATQLNGQWQAIGIVRDITERRRAEKLLRENEQNYRTLADSAPALIWASGPDKLCNYFNQPWLKFTGRTLEQEMGNGWAEGVHPDDFQHCLEVYVGAFERREPFSMEYRLRRHDGEYRWMRDDGCPRHDSDGNFLGYLGYLMDVTERKRAEAAIEHANRALTTLSAVNRSLTRVTDEKELLRVVCQSIVEQGGYRMAWVGYRQHDEGKSVKVVASAGYDAGYLDSINVTWAETERGMGPTGRAIRSGTVQLCQDFVNDPRDLPWRDAALERGYASNIALPLADGEVFGALTVYAGEVNAFVPGEVSLLEEMANDLAFGVRGLHTREERDLALKLNQQHLDRLRGSLEETIRAIATIVEMRDPYTAGHQAKVAELAAAIARQMGLSDEQVHGIHLAGIVHDLGKIQIPAEILSKPGRISEIEHSFIKIHPQAGYDILKDIDFPWPIAEMVRQHHERLDGSGYPQGLKGDAILLETRILSVADVVEAMSSHRPYRPGLGVEAALGEIDRLRGIHFDPQVVDACLALFREQGYAFGS